jgi:hypothetical protein
MKQLFLVLIILLSSTHALAKSKWLAGKEVRTETKAGLFKGRVYQKYLIDKRGAFPLGQVTYMSSPKGKQKFEKWSKEFMQSVRDGIKSTKWKDRKFENAVVLEGYWNKGNRFYKYYMWEDDKNFNYTVASSRIIYKKTFYFDSEIIQRLIYFKGIDGFSKKTTLLQTIHNFILSDAYAQSGGCGCAPTDYLCLLTCTSGGGGSTGGGGLPIPGGSTITPGQIDNLITEIGTLNSNMTDFNNTLGTEWPASNANWQETNTQLGTANANWAETNKLIEDNLAQMKEMQTMVDTNWKETNKIIDENWKETNRIAEKGIDETTALMKKALDPKHAFVLAAATGAGAALGATAMNMLIDGVVWGIKSIIKLFQDKYTDQQKLQMFQKAIQNYEKLDDQLKDLEKALDTLPVMMGISQIFNQAREDALYTLQDLEVDKQMKDYELQDKEDEIQRIRKSSMPGSQKVACMRQMIKDKMGVESKIQELDSLIKFVKDNGDFQDDFCRNMNKLWKKYVDAETAMAQLRRILADPEIQGLYLENMDEKFKDMRERQDNIQDKDEYEDMSDDIQKRAKKSKKKALDQLEDAKDSLLDMCEDAFGDHLKWYQKDDSKQHCKDLMENARSANGLTTYVKSHQGDKEGAYRYYLSIHYKHMPKEKRKKLAAILHKKMDILDRGKNFKEWEKEIKQAYDRKVKSAKSYWDFIKPYHADLVRIDEKLHAYQVEATLDFFKRIAIDMNRREKEVSDKMKSRGELLKRLCPATIYDWNSRAFSTKAAN